MTDEENEVIAAFKAAMDSRASANGMDVLKSDEIKTEIGINGTPRFLTLLGPQKENPFEKL
tara:strand:+ start:4143 stop:4325 length:183 start_codon:yes stop_codon:yes gene_type:complete